MRIGSKINVFVLFASVFCQGVFAQDNDIGISFNAGLVGNSSNQFEDLRLEYRRGLSERTKLVFGLTYATSGRSTIYPNDRGATDYGIYEVRRIFRTNNNDVNLRAGINRSFQKAPLFSWTGGLVLGYRYKNAYSFNHLSVFSENEDGEYYEVPGPYIQPSGEESFEDYGVPGGPDRLGINSHFLRTGVHLGLEANVPLGQRFLINFGIDNHFGISWNIANQVIESSTSFEPMDIHTFELSSRLNVGVRYKLGIKK